MKTVVAAAAMVVAFSSGSAVAQPARPGAASGRPVTRQGVVAAAASYGRTHGYHVGISVYDTQTGQIYNSGEYNRTFASESLIKVFIATRLLLEGRMHGYTARAAYKMITQSDDGIASSLYGSVGGDSLITWVKSHYHVPNLGSPPRRAGWWGNTHVTPNGMVRLYAKLKADRRVAPWLLDAMHHAHTYGSDGFYQFFGIPSATTHFGVKQGWGTDYDDWGRSADENTTGFVDGNRYAVAILARGPVSTYGRRIGDLLTHVARMVLPGGRFPSLRPVVTAVRTTHGTSVGGTRVTIHGTDFVGITAVTFGAFRATHVHVLSMRTITAVSPRHPAARIFVRVVTRNGHSLKSPAAAYAFDPTPTITSISPRSGPTKGGTLVTIHGQNLADVRTVGFGGHVAGTPVHRTAHTLTVRTPLHSAPGTVHVHLLSKCCASPPSRLTFTFAGPAVTSLAPVNGPATGGTTVVITGVGFTPDSTVAFGAVPAASATVDSPTQITVVTPAHPVGAIRVRVTNSSGGSRRLDAGDVFTFQ